MFTKTHLRLTSPVLFTLAAFLLTAQPALALMWGEVGNKSVRDPGWPKGTAAVFNIPERASYYYADFGRWHSECRGDAKLFSRVLANFAKIDAKKKQVVVHDGIGVSYWMKTFEKSPDPTVDWILFVPTPSPTRDKLQPGYDPILKIDVYTDGKIKWDEVAIPKGLDVVDQRLESHGYELKDGNVIEGTVKDLITGKPLAATMKLQDHGNSFKTVRTVKCDEEGHWVVKNAPQGWHQITLVADGFAPRVVTSLNFTDQPGWSSHASGLAPAVELSGVVKDPEGKPVKGARVGLRDLVTKGGVHYGKKELVTDKNGRFQTDQIPAGKVTLWAHKTGFLPATEVAQSPTKNVELKLGLAGELEITVDFGEKGKKGGYIVNIEEAAGSKIGSWGGSANVNDKGQYTFKNVPPNKYVIWGRPNPGSTKQTTDKVTVELTGGQSTKVTLKAK
ncbi:MAG: carboxypeptidase regulatory-like domain-containing protein [Planctomycetes bacterium]|nr:carboxypeptidase regulatory-like domain-containing protein [Planctomycetota bacterium]